jgi:hypothetical protein
MFDQRLREIWIALLLALATVAPASADGPRAGFKLDQEATVFISPDQKVRVEQYYKERKDEWRLLFQFWTFDADHRHGFLLNPGEGDDLAGYRAGFRFSPDSQWLVRMQKLGSGSQTLFLHKRKGVSIFTRDREATWRSGLGLFLHDADIQGDASGP